MLSGWKTLIVKYFMTCLQFPMQFNGNLRFFIYLKLSLLFSVPCEFEIESPLEIENLLCSVQMQ